MLDLTLAELPRDGVRVVDVTWPPATFLIAVRRGGDTLVPRGETHLGNGDRLSVLARDDRPTGVADAIASTAAATPR